MNTRRRAIAPRATSLGRRLWDVVAAQHAEPLLRSALAWSGAARLGTVVPPPPRETAPTAGVREAEDAH